MRPLKGRGFGDMGGNWYSLLRLARPPPVGIQNLTLPRAPQKCVDVNALEYACFWVHTVRVIRSIKVVD